MTRTAIEVCKSFKITGPDDDNTMWLQIFDQGDGKQAMFNLGSGNAPIVSTVVKDFEANRCAALDEAPVQTGDLLHRSDVLSALDEVIGGITRPGGPSTYDLINRIKELPARPPSEPESLTEPPETPDYRFGRLVKGETYAYARGLLVAPTHLPKALDAMEKDGWSLVGIFGETDSENVGFIFRKSPLHMQAFGRAKRPDWWYADKLADMNPEQFRQEYEQQPVAPTDDGRNKPIDSGTFGKFNNVETTYSEQPIDFGVPTLTDIYTHEVETPVDFLEQNDSRPANCRYRLIDEGEQFPNSRCESCQRHLFIGFSTECKTNGRNKS